MQSFNKNELKTLIKRAIYKKSFYEFVKDFWKFADPSLFIDSPLIEYYCEVFQYMCRSWWNYVPVEHLDEYVKKLNKDDDIIDVRQNKNNLNLCVPPRHSKSMIFNVLGPIWLWILHPIKAVSVSHTGQLASQMNSKRQAVINSPYFKEIFPEIILTTNSTTLLKDSRGGELYSINRNAFTGYGGDVIINDDLTNAETARKDREEMNNAWSYFQNTMPSRINDINKCIIMNIQQRLAVNDITGHILNDRSLRNEYIFITLPAIFEKRTHLVFPISGKILTFEKDDVLWKERFGDYKKLKSQVGSIVFDTQYLQKPSSSDRALIKEYMIIEKSINEVPEYTDADLVYASHDFPVKDKESSDFLGSILGYKVNNTLYIRDCLEKKLAFVRSVEYVKHLYDVYPGIIQVIEDKANGSPILQQLQDEVSGLIPYNPKSNSKVQRLESASLYMESKNVVFVKDEWDEINKRYVLSDNLLNLKERLLQFPYVKHDDIVDALSMLILYVFLDKRNSVYLQVFNEDNIIKENEIELVKSDKTLNYTYFINREKSYIKVSKIAFDYVKNKMYVVDEYEYKEDISNVINDVKKDGIKLLIDTSEVSLSLYDRDIIIEQYIISNFNDSIELTKRMFSKKSVLISRYCKRTIADIESFKYLNNLNDEVKYVTENDGFVRNIRYAIKYYGMI